MLDLIRSLSLSGRPVPVPWRELGRLIRPRTQNLLNVIAAAGVGKSIFALEWLARTNALGLYISLDTALIDHAIRLIARSTNNTVEQVQEGHDADPTAWANRWRPTLEELQMQTRFCDRTMVARTVGEVVAAEAEYWGEPPLITVIDNTMNFLEKEESAGEYRRVFHELRSVAREQDTLVMALHHLRKKPPKAMKDDDDDQDEGTQRVRLSDALYDADKEAQFVLGLHRPIPSLLNVGVLKNRMGPSSSQGRLEVKLSANFERMSISEWI